MLPLRPQHEVDPGGRPSPYNRQLHPVGQRSTALRITQRPVTPPTAQTIEPTPVVATPPVAEPIVVEPLAPVIEPAATSYFQVAEPMSAPIPMPLPTIPVYVEPITPVSPLPPSGARSFEFVSPVKSTLPIAPIEQPVEMPVTPVEPLIASKPDMTAVMQTAVGPSDSLNLPADLTLDEPAPIEPRIPVHHSWQRSRRPRFVLATIGLALIVGAGIGIQGWLQTRQPSGQAQAATQSADVPSGTPSETPLSPSAVTKHTAAAMDPRVLNIERLGVASRVMPLDIDHGGHLQAPKTIYDSAWYAQSAKPGEPGASLLIAHANGPTKEGVFYGLKTLTAGDLIQIERGDRAILTFEVVSVETITASKVDMNSLLTSASSDRPGLNLVTAAGNSTERTVVFSILRR